MVKLAGVARGHFVKLNEVIMHVIECNLGHMATKAPQVYNPLPKHKITKASFLHRYHCIERLYLRFEIGWLNLCIKWPFGFLTH